MEGSASVGSLLIVLGGILLVGTGARSASPTRADKLTFGTILCVLVLFFGERVTIAAATGDLSVVRFFQYFMAGGICAFLTHAACTPIDVVKTRIQTMPGKYGGMMDGFQRIVSEEGAGMLLKGLGATAGGYFLHGAFKYSFYELFKTTLSDTAAEALKPSFGIASAAGFLAECIACILLCPMEAVRIRSVSDPSFPSGVLNGLKVLIRLEGSHGLYKGLPAMLLKQVPYTVGQFVSFELSLTMVKYLVSAIANVQLSGVVSFTAGLLAGISAAVISHPGDTILSKINQEQSEGSAIAQISRVARQEGLFGLCLGLTPRIVQVSCMVGGQFAIYDSIKQFCGLKVAAALPAVAAVVDVAKLTPVKIQ